MILYTFPVRPEYQALLETYSRQHKTPVVAIHSAGLYSYFQITLPGAFPIVETHPDETATTDLRLLAPWPELEQFAQELTKDVDNLDDHDHGHLPYVAILLHYLGKWRDLHDGTNPTTYAEKTAFRRMVQDATRRDNPEVGEENFDEAVAAVLKTVTPASLPAGLREVFQYEHAEPVCRIMIRLEGIHADGETQTEQKSVFWVIADAVKQFYDKHKCLPVPGSVPDMKAQSKVYVQLQNIYKAKARKDAGEVLELVRTTPAGHGVDPAQVELFCKNAAFVKLVNATRAARSPSEAMDRLRRVAGQ